MLFQSSNGKVFNSISVKHFKERLGLSAREYSACIGGKDDLYIIWGDEELEEGEKRAHKFSNKFKVNVSIWYFARESEDEYIEKFIKDINTISNCNTNKYIKMENDTSCKENKNDNKETEDASFFTDIYKRYSNSISN